MPNSGYYDFDENEGNAGDALDGSGDPPTVASVLLPVVTVLATVTASFDRVASAALVACARVVAFHTCARMAKLEAELVAIIEALPTASPAGRRLLLLLPAPLPIAGEGEDPVRQQAREVVETTLISHWHAFGPLRARLLERANREQRAYATVKREIFATALQLALWDANDNAQLLSDRWRRKFFTSGSAVVGDDLRRAHLLWGYSSRNARNARRRSERRSERPRATPPRRRWKHPAYRLVGLDLATLYGNDNRTFYAWLRRRAYRIAEEDLVGNPPAERSWRSLEPTDVPPSWSADPARGDLSDLAEQVASQERLERWRERMTAALALASPAERIVMQLHLKGYSATQIAEQLALTPSTIRVHQYHFRQKARMLRQR